MTIQEFIEYVEENNVPRDYEIEMGYDSDGDYSYGYWTIGTEDYIHAIDHENHKIVIGTYLTTH